jgi:hypothetical protein
MKHWSLQPLGNREIIHEVTEYSLKAEYNYPFKFCKEKFKTNESTCISEDVEIFETAFYGSLPGRNILQNKTIAFQKCFLLHFSCTLIFI